MRERDEGERGAAREGRGKALVEANAMERKDTGRRKAKRQRCNDSGVAG